MAQTLELLRKEKDMSIVKMFWFFPALISGVVTLLGIIGIMLYELEGISTPLVLGIPAGAFFIIAIIFLGTEIISASGR